MAGYSALYFPAVQLAGVATATVVSIGAAPLLSGAAHTIRGGRVNRRWLTSTTVAVAGMGMVVLPGSHDAASWLGIVLATLAAATYAWQAHAIHQLAHRHRPVETVAVLFSGAALLLAPFSVSGIGILTATPQAITGVLYLGLFTTAIAYALFAYGVPHTGAPTAVTLTLLEPVAATALAALIAHQVPSIIQVVGIATTPAALGWLAGRPSGRIPAGRGHNRPQPPRPPNTAVHEPNPAAPGTGDVHPSGRVNDPKGGLKAVWTCVISILPGIFPNTVRCGPRGHAGILRGGIRGPRLSRLPRGSRGPGRRDCGRRCRK
jgi:DME family drug/metabolite transporter